VDKIVECVPNFSEGKNKAIIQAITHEIDTTENVMLLDVDPGAATNRTVVTFIGTPDGVTEAAFRAIRKAAELIDMRKHRGEHPRIGATDVCPFVPVAGVTMEECVQIARDVGKRVGEEMGIPIYLYEEAATTPERKNLANIRQGEYEGLAAKLSHPDWQPDFGPAQFNASTGATIIGAREFLIAYNINLNTRDRKLAHEIALNLRESGRAKRDEDGRIIKDADGATLLVPGRLKDIKAVGWYIEEYGSAQISINLLNYKTTPLYLLFDEACKEAERLGLRVTGSELVGLIPLQALLGVGKYFLSKQGKSTGVPEEELIHIAVKSLGLDELAPFAPEKKIIEYRFRTCYGKLASQRIFEFANELSTDSPAPGGGSVVALAGALAASLAAMVANLTHGNKKYKANWQKMEDVAVFGQQLKMRLLRSIDEDTDAFNRVMIATRLPRNTAAEMAARDNALEEATQQATQVPFRVMELALQALKLCKAAAELGNVNAVSDAGVGALLGNAAVNGAFLNVKINLPKIRDRAFKDNIMSKAETISTEANILRREIMDWVNGKLEEK